MEAKICGVKDTKTLHFIMGHNNPPKFIGFIFNYPKSKRNLNLNDLKNLINVKKSKNINFVCVLVKPNDETLKVIKKLKFDYLQLYGVSPVRTKKIKQKYNIKIITALTIENLEDVLNYKNFENISDIILFDSKGYEKSHDFNHQLMENIPTSINKMLAGNIQYDDELEKFVKITDIIDISGSLETLGEKDISKINTFLNKIRNLNDKTQKKNTSN